MLLANMLDTGIFLNFNIGIGIGIGIDPPKNQSDSI